MLCDGAMGTLLYSKGIFINRCYDELNISQPELIRAVHHDYLQAGAEIIETNTFGANSFRLARHSLADRVRDINLAGAQVAHEAAKSFDVWVAGSIGPLGVRIEPLGKTSFEEARAAFREQIDSAGRRRRQSADARDVRLPGRTASGRLACRDVDPKIPIVAQVTIDEDGNCLDGSDPEAFAARLTEWNVDVHRHQLQRGPVAMLDAIERVRAVTSLPLAAQPNAGMPRSVEGRNIYLCSPEYMASYTRKFVAAGVQLIGGCCGTTPDHIRAMKSALRVRGAPAARLPLRRAFITRTHATVVPASIPIAERSRLGAKIRRRRICHDGRDRSAERHRHPQRRSKARGSSNRSASMRSIFPTAREPRPA